MSETIKNAWTPGPWVMEPIRRGDKEIYINQPDDSWERLEATVSRDDCDSEMALANAKLIAAAPDLYDALQVAYNLLKSLQPDCNCIACQMASAALAKARGGE